MVMALRRDRTPYTPRQNSTTASSSGRTSGISVLLLPLGQRDRSDQRGQQQDREDLERQHPGLEDRRPDGVGRAGRDGFDLLVAKGKDHTGAEQQREHDRDSGR